MYFHPLFKLRHKPNTTTNKQTKKFGYGKSYSTFKYTNLRLSSSTATATSKLTVSVDVTNASDRDGSEVVQLYVSDLIASVAVPNKQLRGFDKVAVPAGETVTVEIPLDVAELGLWDVRYRYVVEPGEFAVFVGASSADLRLNATLTVS